MTDNKRLLKVFLSYSPDNKDGARNLFEKLKDFGADVWFYEESLLPGQKWQDEAPKAIQDADVILICLSQKTLTNDGRVHTEIKWALEVANRKPDGFIYIVPVKFDDCIVPENIKQYHSANIYDLDGFEKIKRTLLVSVEKNSLTLNPNNGKTMVNQGLPAKQSTFVERRLAKNELLRKARND